ncbi:hypothetical protein Tco_0030006, partial [Tanacetum coccineum]
EILKNCAVKHALVKVELVWVTCQEVFTRGPQKEIRESAGQSEQYCGL